MKTIRGAKDSAKKKIYNAKKDIYTADPVLST